MANMRYPKKIQTLVAGTLMILLLLAMPAEAKTLAVNWYKPYYEHTNSITLPADDQIDTAFSFQGQIDAKYNAVLIRVAKDDDETYYYYPANNNAIEGKVFLRFGQGTYQVEINLVKPNPENPAEMKFDWLAKTQMENIGAGDGRYLLPSWGIESDNQEIINKAREITAGIKDDYNKVKAIHDWVSKNISYDIERYNANKVYDNEGAVKALQIKKGLCRDYSNLITALARAIGLEARTVIGEANGGGKWYGHAWNEVKAGGRWISMDATWAAGKVKGDKFIPQFSRKYFDLSPEIFNQTHRETQPAY